MSEIRRQRIRNGAGLLSILPSFEPKRLNRKDAKDAKGFSFLLILKERPQYHLPELRGMVRIGKERCPGGYISIFIFLLFVRFIEFSRNMVSGRQGSSQIEPIGY